MSLGLEESGLERSWFSGSRVKQTVLTRKSLTISSTRNREHRKYCKCMTRGRFWVIVNGRVFQQNSVSEREQRPDPPSVLLQDTVDLGLRSDVMLVRHRDCRIGACASFSLSHTLGNVCWQCDRS